MARHGDAFSSAARVRERAVGHETAQVRQGRHEATQQSWIDVGRVSSEQLQLPRRVRVRHAMCGKDVSNVVQERVALKGPPGAVAQRHDHEALVDAQCPRLSVQVRRGVQALCGESSRRPAASSISPSSVAVDLGSRPGAVFWTGPDSAPWLAALASQLGPARRALADCGSRPGDLEP